MIAIIGENTYSVTEMIIALDLYDLKTISLLTGLLLVIILIARLRFWRREAGKAFCAAAKFAPSDDIRARYARRGVLAGNKESRMLYIFSSPDSFSDRHPLSIFKIKKIPCVFSGFYFPARHRKRLSAAQEDFTRSVLAFKDGMNDGIDFFRKGMDCLKPHEGTVIMFMPCSAWWKYWVRFRHIADYIDSRCPQLVNGFYYYTYLGERDSLHMQKNRAGAVIERNFEIRRDLTGRDVIVVDDVITSGKSLRQLKKQIEAAGGHVSGAVFFAGTFALPGKITTFLTAISEEISGNDTSCRNACDMTVPHGQTAAEYPFRPESVSDRKDCDNGTARPHPTGKRHRYKDTVRIPDLTIVYDDSSMVFCYRHFIPGKQPYYTAVHIPADKKEAEHTLRRLADIIEADRHREPTEYELSLGNHPYCD